MINLGRSIVALVACALFGAAALSAQRPEPQPWTDMHYEALYPEVKGESKYSNYTLEDLSAARARSDQISEEFTCDGGGEWAGEYGSGGDLDYTHFRWSPKSGFVQALIYTCIPSVRRLNYGTAVEYPTYVDLVPAIPLGTSWKPGSAWRLLKVTWGEDRFLVPEDQLGSFCDYVAGLGEYNTEIAEVSTGPFFHRWDGEHPDPANELPVVPPGYEHLVKRPVDVAIVGVGRSRVVKTDDFWDRRVTSVTIDAGRSSGVRNGMVFHLFDSRDGEVITIRRVGARTSEGEISRLKHKPGVKLYDTDDGTDPDYPPVRIGWKASTSLHKYLASCHLDGGDE